MNNNLLRRGVEYSVKGVNYNRYLKYTKAGWYDNGLLIIEPYQPVVIFIESYRNTDDDVAVIVKKYDCNQKLVSETDGYMNRLDLIKLLELD